jgi:hypothetical protein
VEIQIAIAIEMAPRRDVKERVRMRNRRSGFFVNIVCYLWISSLKGKIS